MCFPQTQRTTRFITDTEIEVGLFWKKENRPAALSSRLTPDVRPYASESGWQLHSRIHQSWGEQHPNPPHLHPRWAEAPGPLARCAAWNSGATNWKKWGPGVHPGEGSGIATLVSRAASRLCVQCPPEDPAGSSLHWADSDSPAARSFLPAPRASSHPCLFSKLLRHRYPTEPASSP